MSLLALNSLIIILSLLVLAKWKEYAQPLPAAKYIYLLLFGSALVLFPLQLIFLPQGGCFEDWRATAIALIQFLVLYIALCVSVHALKALVILFASQEASWTKRLVALSCAGVCTILLLIWTCVGTHLSFDFEFRQYPQILSGEYNLMHTIAHTLFCEVLLAAWNNCNSIVLAQVLGTAAAASCLFIWARHSRLSRWLAWGAAAGIILQFHLVSTVIKDTPYGISMILLSIGLCQYLLRKNTSSLWMIGIGLSGVACLRYDGFIPFALTAAVLVIYSLLSGHRRLKLLYPVIISTACWVMSFFILPWMLDAVPGASGTKHAKMAHVICDVVAEGGTVSPENLALIEQEIKPLNIIQNNYNIFQDKMHPIVATGHGERYIWNFAKLSEEEHFRYSFAFALTGKGETIRKLFFTVARDNPLKVAKILLFNTQLTWNLPKSIEPLKVPHQYFLFYGIVLMLMIAKKCCRASLLIPFVPFIAVACVIMLAATTYEPRYLLPIKLMFPVLLVYTVECFRLSKDNKESTNTNA